MQKISGMHRWSSCRDIELHLIVLNQYPRLYHSVSLSQCCLSFYLVLAPGQPLFVQLGRLLQKGMCRDLLGRKNRRNLGRGTLNVGLIHPILQEWDPILRRSAKIWRTHHNRKEQREPHELFKCKSRTNQKQAICSPL